MKNKIAIKFTIKEIFAEKWDEFVIEMSTQNKVIRASIMESVEKIIGCQDPQKGFALYSCPQCFESKIVPFTCKSRFCNSCGSKYSKDRALNMSAKLLKCSHRHVVFTIAEELRRYFAIDRKLLNLLFQAAADAVTFRFNSRSKSENYTPGMICVLHTFGRDLKWNPHIHMILCMEAVGKSGIWKTFEHLNYEGLRQSWQYCILKLLSAKITTPSFKALVNELYSNYKDGFYVNSPPIKNFSAGVVNYILRYAGRPALAQSRIDDYDGVCVTFSYTPHGSDELVNEKLPVFDFIKKLIIHIPEKHFKMIRYYGFYCVRNDMFHQYLLRAKRIEPHMLKQLRRIYSSWRNRIKHFFGYDPIKCVCGGYFELIEIFKDPRKIDYYLSLHHEDSS